MDGPAPWIPNPKPGEIQVQSEYKLHLHDQDWNDKTKKMKEEMEAGRVAAEGRCVVYEWSMVHM